MNQETVYDLTIIGGGPAGSTASIYSARKKIKTIFITENFGGQSTLAPEIQNWPGTKSMTGINFAKTVEDHVKSYEGDSLEIKEERKVTSLKKRNDNLFLIETNKDDVYVSRKVLIATGGERKKLKVPGADEYEHKGITYCATCDAPLFTNQDVAVIGGGNAAFGTTLQLLSYAKSVTILGNHNDYVAERIKVEEVMKNPKVKAIKNVCVNEILGEKMVNGLIYEDKKTGEKHQLDVTGIFVEVGITPATEFASGLLDIDEKGYIKINHQNQRTSTDGVWAAGDCTDSLYKQNIIAAGDGAKALEDIYESLRS